LLKIFAGERQYVQQSPQPCQLKQKIGRAVQE